ncbi:hypothetical protein EX30DRAFT_318855 [Ascodesmis nigricans]|uniref:Phosphatidic acid phosphatase type 2/haloperoxidase domain-containing protein n=1 Tax=Ascodesmis nigricans TaxID=341454 RepID=A0A4S2MY85_9PEZI|nr:hypothetical protein EX30DRAFT_318855 [Ascodesmis nigricans]
MFANPKFDQIIPIIPDAMIAVFTPILIIVIANFFGIGTHQAPGKVIPRPRRRGTFFFSRGSFWNVNNGCMGVIYSVMTGACIQIVIKLSVPGLRPHFLSVCDPVLPLPPGIGFGGLYYTADICRDHENRKGKIANAMQSFPSGHAVAAWAGLFYASLYLNAHMKIFANYHPSYWKLMVFVAPLIAATILVGQLSLDMSHNWYDIVAGSLIGVGMSILAYRMCFASVWDFRWNHVPLIRGAEWPTLTYSEEEMVAWSGGVATRRGGWGVPGRGRVGGAPGDVKWGNFNMTGTSGIGKFGGTIGRGTGYQSGYDDGTGIRGIGYPPHTQTHTTRPNHVEV